MADPATVGVSSERLAKLSAFFQRRYIEPGKLPCVQMLVARHGQLVHQVELGRMADPWAINAGYLNRPVETAAAWRNGWFHTGDAFSRDADGHFYFRDRVKDCIRRRAENISSFEVEAGVRPHPEVVDCAAVAHKLGENAGADEEIRLFVVRVPGSQLGAEPLIRWLIPRMPRFMIPRFVEFLDALPRTPTLKVQKAELRARPLDAGVWDRERAGLELPR